MTRGFDGNGTDTLSTGGKGPDRLIRCRPSRISIQSVSSLRRYTCGTGLPSIRTISGRQPPSDPGSATATLSSACTCKSICIASRATSTSAATTSAQLGTQGGGSNSRCSSSSRMSGDGVWA